MASDNKSQLPSLIALNRNPAVVGPPSSKGIDRVRPSDIAVRDRAEELLRNGNGTAVVDALVQLLRKAVRHNVLSLGEAEKERWQKALVRGATTFSNDAPPIEHLKKRPRQLTSEAIAGAREVLETITSYKDGEFLDFHVDGPLAHLARQREPEPELGPGERLIVHTIEILAFMLTLMFGAVAGRYWWDRISNAADGGEELFDLLWYFIID
tara:strand:- start:59 stop:691 length:633 start_codon:yes stop_codon:yes gene_type:complete